MASTFFVLAYKLDGIHSELLWFTNDVDGVITDDQDKIVSFCEPAVLSAFAARRGLTVEAEEPTPHDLDAIVRWLDAPDAGAIQCEAFLNCWNLFDDAARSVKDDEFHRLSLEAGRVYDLLFWGCNLPSVTPSGEQFHPDWTDLDVQTIANVLEAGMAMFRRHLPA